MLAWVINAEIALLAVGLLADLGLSIIVGYQAWSRRYSAICAGRLEALVERSERKVVSWR